MTTVPIETWNEIVNHRTGDKAAEVALTRLRDAAWLAKLGTPSGRDHEVVRVSGWPVALRMFTEAEADSEHATGSSGTLNGPFFCLLRRLDADETLNRVTARAANHALDTLIGYSSAAGDGVRAHMAPDADTFDTEISIGDYVHRFIRLLFIEIYAGDVAEPRCTYFRDQLGWFLAGFLPCGWDGAWPNGRMKVF